MLSTHDLSLFILSGLLLTASGATRKLRSAAITAWLNRSIGALLVLLAARLALARQP
jgi:threonine/homoserine/homoserine lactone efflux protein